MIVRPRRSRKLERWRSMTIFGNNGLLVLAALLACWTGCFLQHAAATTNSADLVALNALKNAWTGQSAFSSWVGNDPCGSKWNGIVCDNDVVTQLNLANQNLTGPIPAAIGDLSNLEALELSLNPNIGGELPAELGNLKGLKSLSIQQCTITGLIPVELSKLTKLEFLALNNNQMRGAIPRQIGRLKELYWFDISLNQIGSTLPVSSDTTDNIGLDNLTSIKHFHFNNNTLQGKIPPEIFKLPSLIHLLLDSNSFIGSIPNVTVTSPLTILRLDHNQLNGPIPDTWRQVVNLTEIHINDNMLQGTIPDLSLLVNLRLLDTSNNPFSLQPIPAFLSSLKMNSLQTLSMVNSNLQGAIPSAIFSNTVIQKIDMSNNLLNGSLSFGEVGAFLEYVNLDGNNITGFLEPPMRGGNQVPLQALLLKGNPVCNNSFYNVENFCVDDSGLSKFYPDPKTPFCGGKKCEAGKVLNGDTCTCGDAMVCHMLLNAPPYQILSRKNMDNLTKDLAGLFSEDKIISEDLTRVEGQVTLAKEQLWIQSASLTDNSRIDFNVDIFPPRGRDWTREEVAYVSTFLYNNTVHLPPSQGPYTFFGCTAAIIESGSGTSLSPAALGGIVAGGVIVFIMVLLIAFYALRQKKRADRAEGMTRPFASWGAGGGSDNGAAPQLKGARFFPVSELKKATNNFSENNEIGSGGYGKVYKAVLASGDVVAVKRAQEGSMQGQQEFKNEIELLSRVHHRNLVGLVGFCYEHGEQMLVYEFMVNGTLRDHLTGKLGGGALTWQNRLNIALGSAKGLSYLHELANPPIIHRDIKATNILLDERLTAKVADFGLSKLAPGEEDGGKNHVSTQVKGTLGYLDPEYYMTQQLTEKSDVYSFGVVLLELLTARAPIEKGKYIVREVRTALDKGGIAALRPMLDRNIKDCPANELEDFLGLALQCVEEAAKNRPTMNEVVKDLERICGHSFTSSVVGAGAADARPGKDPYSEEDLSKETQFQYSGGFTVPPEVQPK